MIHDEHSRSCLFVVCLQHLKKSIHNLEKVVRNNNLQNKFLGWTLSKKEIIKKINAEFTFTSFRYFYLFFTNIKATLPLVRLLLIFVSVVLQIFLQSSQIEVHKSSNNCEVTNFLEVLQPTRTIYHNLPTGKFPQLLHILIFPVFFLQKHVSFCCKSIAECKELWLIGAVEEQEMMC